MTDANEGNPLEVTLSIPCLAEYVGVARLAILGVASRLNLSYDEVEDLRLAVGEACTGAVEQNSGSERGPSAISLHCEILPSELTVSVNYKNGVTPSPPSDGANTDSIGALLMEILVDSMSVEHDSERGTTIRLTKTVQAA
jgi:serine/threonine-protein kinase RsbW